MFVTGVQFTGVARQGVEYSSKAPMLFDQRSVTLCDARLGVKNNFGGVTDHYMGFDLGVNARRIRAYLARIADAGVR